MAEERNEMIVAMLHISIPIDTHKIDETECEKVTLMISSDETSLIATVNTKQ